MVDIEITGLDEFSHRLENIMEQSPQMRREFHEEVAEKILNNLKVNINASVNDSHGHVKSWQESEVGTGGGYAAVRARKGQTGANSPGAITNYLENGHRTNAKRPHKKRWVEGRHFYATTRGAVLREIMPLAEAFAKRIAAELGGK